jgi:hypothetical protein
VSQSLPSQLAEFGVYQLKFKQLLFYSSVLQHSRTTISQNKWQVEREKKKAAAMLGAPAFRAPFSLTPDVAPSLGSTGSLCARATKMTRIAIKESLPSLTPF